MAKRKKSKKSAKSEAVAEAQALDSQDSQNSQDSQKIADTETELLGEADIGVASEEASAEAAADSADEPEDAAGATGKEAPNATDAEDTVDQPALAIQGKRRRGKNRAPVRTSAKIPVEEADQAQGADDATASPLDVAPADATDVVETAENASASAADTPATDATDVAEVTAEPILATDEESAAWSQVEERAENTPTAEAEAYAETWASQAEGSALPPDGGDSDAVGETIFDSEGQPGEGDGDGTPGEALTESRLESIIESLLFASDKALSLSDLKRLIGERDGKKVTAAVENLVERRRGTGIEVIALSTGWHLRTSTENAAWVGKLLVGKPVRLSRAMLETLAIVAYRQPVTRPEVDDIRGVDCGAVLKTLLDRGLIRIIGKKEEVGRPMLYGTTPEFLRVFNLRDLSELPTLREFYDLSAEDQSKVEAEHGPPAETPSATTAKPDVALTSVSRGALASEPEDDDPLLDELDEASQLAKKALGDLEQPTAEGDETTAGEGEGAKNANDDDKGDKAAPSPTAE